MHNDIKPQNYLVNFQTIDHKLQSNIEIVLTDFGLAGSESKGGTPVFASPECLANSDRKNISSDTFSLGRVFLFMILPKEEFLKFLFLPLTKDGKEKIMKIIENEPILSLISKMMENRMENRIKTTEELKKTDSNSENLRTELNKISKMKVFGTVTKINEEIEKSAIENKQRREEYIAELKCLS